MYHPGSDFAAAIGLRMDCRVARMSFDASRSDLVVLIPGLWMPAWVMLPLAWRLRGKGFRCVRFGYASARVSLAENAHRLAGFLRAQGEGGLHLVGHSLGGVLALHATKTRALARVRSIVMIGSPAAGSFAARRLLEYRLGRWVVGRTLPEWLQIAHPTAPENVALGVIAGTRALGLGMIVAPDLERPHDGVVRVCETAVSGAADQVVLSVNHAAMLTSGRVARLTATFLRTGRFDPAVAAREAAAGTRSGGSVNRKGSGG